jgi:hypothetical protein
MDKKKVAVVSTMSIAAVVSTLVMLGMQSMASDTQVNVIVPSGNYRIGDTFNVSIRCSPTRPIKAFEFKVNFNKNVVGAVKVYEGKIFQGYQTFFNKGIINNQTGTIINIYNLIVGPGNVTTPNNLVNISFRAVGYGLCNITLYNVGITNETIYIPILVSNSSITIISPYDMNGDRVVNMADLLVVASHYGETGASGWIKEDVNRDGKVNVLDLVFLATHWGSY